MSDQVRLLVSVDLYLNARRDVDVERLDLWEDRLPVYGGGKGAAAKMTV